MEIIVGIISGIIASWGMGGGAFLISILSGIFNIEQHIAQSTNFIFFIPTSLCSIIVNSKNKNIKYKLAIVITIFGVIGAIIGSTLSNKLDTKILKRIFAIMLIGMACVEIYNLYKMYRKDIKRHNNIKQQ